MEQTLCPIDVISICSADGQIRPLRFRMEDESHQLIRVDVEEVISTRQIQYVGIESYTFLCRALADGRSLLVELKYYIRTHTWCLVSRYNCVKL